MFLPFCSPTPPEWIGLLSAHAYSSPPFICGTHRSLPCFSCLVREQRNQQAASGSRSLPQLALAVCDFSSLRTDADSSNRFSLVGTSSGSFSFCLFGFLCYGSSKFYLRRLLLNTVSSRCFIPRCVLWLFHVHDQRCHPVRENPTGWSFSDFDIISSFLCWKGFEVQLDAAFYFIVSLSGDSRVYFRLSLQKERKWEVKRCTRRQVYAPRVVVNIYNQGDIYTLKTNQRRMIRARGGGGWSTHLL